MGCFDHVEYEAQCPKCGALLTDWQTKDAENVFATLQPFDVTTFHDVCYSCKAYVVCTVEAEVIRTVYVKSCEITIKAITRDEYIK